MSGLIFGHVEHDSVCDALLRLQPSLPPAGAAVVRCIDSSASPDGLARILTFHGVPHVLHCGNAVVRGRDFWGCPLAQVFTGFDEVWIFPGDAPGVDLGAVSGSTTSEWHNLPADVPEDLVQAMERTRCLLMLADGFRLNYGTTDASIARELAAGAE